MNINVNLSRRGLIASLAGVALVAPLAGCDNDSASAGGSDAAEQVTLTVGASPSPHAEILNDYAAPLLEEQGIVLDVKEYTDYILPNQDTSAGEIDCNYFQHINYLNNYNKENGTDLVNVGAIHFEPMGVFAGKSDDLENIADGAMISIPNDPTNEGRALKLLEEQGLITLAEDAGLEATPKDITDNPHNISFVELAAEQIPRSLQDFDFAVINGNYALQAGLNASTDALAVETSDSEAVQKYVNVVAVKEGHENDEGIQALVQVLKSDEIKKFIEDTYQGSVVPYEE